MRTTSWLYKYILFLKSQKYNISLYILRYKLATQSYKNEVIEKYTLVYSYTRSCAEGTN